MAYWRVPDAHPEHVGIIRSHQFRIVASQFPLIAISTCTLLGVLVPAFWHICNQPLVVSLSVLLLMFNLGNVYLWWYWRSQPKEVRVSEWACWALALDVGLMAVLDVILAAHAFDIGDSDNRILFIGIASAVMATGGWIFSPLLHTGLAWSVIVCGFGMFALGINHWQEYPALIALIGFYGMVLSVTVVVNARTVMESISNSLNLEKQNQVVGLLLNDFEENASDWLWEIDRHGRLRHAPMRLAKTLGLTTAQLKGRHLQTLLEGLSPDDEAARRMYMRLAQMLEMGEPFRGAIIPVLIDTRKRWWAITAKPLKHPRRGVRGWRGVGSDVTELHERDMELIRLANVDSLTGLANRHRFHQVLADFFAVHDLVIPCTLFLFDLDNFKHVNDLMGHTTGDTLLCEVSKRLEGQLERGALLARLGGDEFALLIPQTLSEQHIDELGSTMQSCLNAPFHIDEHAIEIHASMGVACAPEDASNAQDLLKAADLALYAAKSAGRHTLRRYHASMDAAVRERLSLLADLKRAIERQEFVLHYQPQIELTSQRLVGFEALVRWHHPTRGLVSPLQFIPAAEDSGLIIPLGQWVLKQACQEASGWPAHLRVAVNISAVEFERSNLRQSIDDALKASQLAPNRLEVELTESTLMHDSEATLTLLHDLRGIGVRLALDDFGTGFSSLAYLRSFPLDQLKIDRSFVSPLGKDESDGSALAVVQAIHGLAKALGLDVMAEGVETTAQHALLMRLGPVHAQGYKFAKPMEAHQVRAFIDVCLREGLTVASERLHAGKLTEPVALPSNAMM